MERSALHECLVEFYGYEANVKQLDKIMKNRTLQPRLIDFYITQYSKRYPQFFVKNFQGVCDVYTNYKLQLKGFHKKNFNMFDKNVKVEISGHCLSIAQFNMFKWIIENDILKLIWTNKNEIQRKYYDFRKHATNKKKSTKRGKLYTFICHPHIVKGVNKAMQR